MVEKFAIENCLKLNAQKCEVVGITQTTCLQCSIDGAVVPASDMSGVLVEGRSDGNKSSAW